MHIMLQYTDALCDTQMPPTQRMLLHETQKTQPSILSLFSQTDSIESLKSVLAQRDSIVCVLNPIHANGSMAS